MAGAKIVFNHFPRMAGAMRVSVAQIVEQTCEAILDEATKTIDQNSRRTGELSESGYTEFSDDGRFGIVGYSDFKAVWLEYGTGAPAPTRAEPFLTPAAEHQRGKFETALRSIEPSLRVNAAGSVGISASSGISFSSGERAGQGAERRR